MKKYFLSVYLLLFGYLSVHAQVHPIAFGLKKDFTLVNAALSNNPILKKSFDDLVKSVKPSLGKDIDVPFPKDPAGGYTHEKHKDNYTLMFNAGLLYQITGDKQYAELIKKILLKYAVLVPTLKNHPQATSNSPGRIFWQALNDANWLMYTGLAFDCIHDYLSTSERKQIADGAFKPEVDFFTGELKDWFDLIHNHAVWACAGVGVIGVATDNQEYIDKALYGSRKDSTAGLFAQMKGLFSPDGYYNEGPYYTRYAIQPFYILAYAVNRVRPQLGVFNYRNNILEKALTGALQQTNIDGTFYAYNDAMKDKTYHTGEMVMALNIAWEVYGANASYLPIAKAQNKVNLNAGGVSISTALLNDKNKTEGYPYRSMEFTDGSDGNKGGVTVMRAGQGKQLTSLIFKYSSHGMSHGHFDKLNINLYDNGHEILQDYGAVRFVGIEQKWGGRYLPENKAYAQQTIAHNTITVDETSHYEAKEAESEKHWPIKLFGSVTDQKLQVIAARDNTAYKQVSLQRSIFQLQLPDRNKPLLIDFFRANSPLVHQYDLPFNYAGTVISTNFEYVPALNSMTTVGKKNGYQFLWKEAEALVKKPMAQFTFLNEESFYTISSAITDSAKILFTRAGATDPNFNIRREPSYIVRTKAANQTYVNVIELHGHYNTVSEVANNTYSAVTAIKIIRDDEQYTAALITISGKELVIVQSNQNFLASTKHSINDGRKMLEWMGPYAVFYNDQVFK